MADLRIIDAPEIPTNNITGQEKLPTGGSGNYSITLDSVSDYTKTKKNLADNTSVDSKVNGVRQELNTHIADSTNPHQVTKGQIGLGNVDNTADADKPVSNSTQAEIISAVAPKADKTYVDTALSSKAEKTYVDNQLTLKANKADVYAKSETYTKQESSALVNNSISTALTPVNTSLDLAKRGVLNRYDSSLTYNSGDRVILTNSDIVKSTIDGNVNNPNSDMTWWVKTNSASQIFDESGKSQQEVNSTISKSIESFPSISTAFNWVKSSQNNYLYVKGGAEYILPTGIIYFNRIVCLSGSATFKVQSSTILNYINKTDGSEVVHLENLKLLVAGHRGNVDSSNSEDMIFPYSQGNTAVKSSTIRNLIINALTDINDENSWSDDVGQSRCVGFINLLVNESSIIENVQHYGLGTFAVVKSNNSNAVHYERNVVGYNNETNIYNQVSTFRIGESSNIKIFNTTAQKAYWLKKNAGILTNGKNCVMCEADHTDSHLIEKCGGKNILERSVYNTSRNTIMRDTIDEGSATCAAMKHTKTIIPSGEAYADGLRAYNITNTSAILDVYGFSKYTLKNFQLKNATKTSARAIYFTNVGDVELKGGSIKNLGMPFYLVGTQNIGSISISDYEIVNCSNSSEGSLWWRRSDATNSVQSLDMRNIKYSIESIVLADLANVGMAFDGVISIKLNNVECISQQSPFIKGSTTTYLEAIDCRFKSVSASSYITLWNNLGGTYAPYANKFDYTVEIESTTSTPKVAIKARFKKLNDSGLVKCHDYWSDIDFSYPVTVANGLNLLTIGDKSFKCIASFGQAQIEFVWDAVTRNTVTIFNVGSKFSTTLASDKINIYVDASNRFTINIGNGTWTGGSGELSVKLQRF